eukprot:TRINITY_DN2127_c0_g1_i1.p1 TRINITY_DN2127_c0_g1~~TRINITY_DN2127_c0_g1_i1.p1  ORF type:complete len:659 (+),score=220.57 TRINITY_DN2127_c0_g1_i1:152-1978(+)
MTQADPSSRANFWEATTTHVDLVWDADFDAQVLKGHVDLHVKVVADSAKQVIFDTKLLTIHSVTDAKSGAALTHSVGDDHEAFGRALTVELPEAGQKKDAVTVIRVAYETSKNSTAIQWLAKEQTADKNHPYVFTQCQAIHARSLLPVQDTPAAKVTYTSQVTVPAPLTALMSALAVDNKQEGERITYRFEQKVNMPSYLIALVIGNLEKREIGPRSAVWSEPSMVDAGAHEFAETEKFLEAGENLLGPYVWGRYDILLLPPSFPYGGMENPCLTFVTPTLLAGDRSLANVVAHEIAHSWTGNLVSCKYWTEFWLNEGFTVFVERKIASALNGEPTFHLQAMVGWRSLEETIAEFGADNQLTNLVPNLDGIDPDDAFSSVPYEKGFNFLFYLQGVVGGAAVFEPFLKHWVQSHAYKSVTVSDFKNFFIDYFTNTVTKDISAIEWDKWFFTPGMPPVTPQFDTTLADSAQKLAAAWIADGNPAASAQDLDGWTSTQKVVFLDELVSSGKLTPEHLARLGELYSFATSKNSELRFRWQLLNLRSSKPEPVFDDTVAFVKEQGRMKFVRPLFRALAGSGEAGRALAVKVFQEHRVNYHPIASTMIAKDLKL